MKSSKDFFECFSNQIGLGKRFPTKADMARYLDLSESDAQKLYKFLRGVDTQYRVIVDWFFRLGGEILEPGTGKARDVCFVNIKSPMAQDGEPPVEPENYTAIPLLSNVGAGPGVIRNEYEKPKEWFLVNRNAQSMTGKRVDTFFAVRIADNATSMEPILHPGDSVLINPTDKDVSSPGGIFLVLDPGPEGSAKIKRVSVSKVSALRVTRLTFYSDNVQGNPPETYTLEHDYGNDIARAIVGRVIWAWSDLSKK